MYQSEDEILAEELAAVAAFAGAGGRLTRFVAKLMKKNVGEIDLVVPLPFEEAVGYVVRVLGRAGRTIDPVPVEPDPDQKTIRVLARGGYGGMNPVLVTALVKRGGETNSEVRLRAATKEGLIKQRAGEQTATHLAAFLAT